jgi:hypothetical protein
MAPNFQIHFFSFFLGRKVFYEQAETSFDGDSVTGIMWSLNAYIKSFEARTQGGGGGGRGSQKHINLVSRTLGPSCVGNAATADVGAH